MRKIIIAFLNPAPRPKFNDMLTAVNRTHELIAQAATPVQLGLLEAKVMQLHEYYIKIEVVEYHVNKLHTAILQKRCELLSLVYPENEEA